MALLLRHPVRSFLRYLPNQGARDARGTYWIRTNTPELFHEPNENCTKSLYVSGFGTYQGIAGYVVLWALVGSISILFSMYSTPPTPLVQLVHHEWMFMSAVWVSYNIGIITVSILEEYYRYCDIAA